MALLYNDEQSVIDREIEVESLKISEGDLSVVFELERCIAWISELQLSKICLQFPDNLLEYSVVIAQNLEKKTCKQIYILGDTSYGSCCVDEVAASHVQADGIIHFGHSCLSTINRLPVLYIFEKKCLNTEKFLASLSSLDRVGNVVVLYDTCYEHCFGATMFLSLARLGCTMSRLNYKSWSHTEDKIEVKFGRQYCLKEDSNPVIYVYVCDSKTCRNLDNFVISMTETTFYQYNADSNQLTTVSVSSVLKKHLYLAEKIKDAQTIGILVATLVVDKYLAAVNHVKSLCKKHGKRSYIISVGKPNVPKLANFPEIDVYVLISCPEMTLPNTKDFLQPIVHLMDVELALNPSRKWENRVNRDFTQLLEGGMDFVPSPDTVLQNMDISLLSNHVRMNGVHNDVSTEVGNCSTLALRQKSTLAVITGREGLTGRSWQGLEPSFGQTPVTLATQGRSGTPASGYTSVESHVDKS